MKKYGIHFAMAGLLVFLLLCLKLSYTEMIKENQPIRDKIGRSIVTGGDTLQIVDYNLLNDTYTLSNGVKVAIEYVKDE